ncbi:hypothetical protein COB57_02715 [Candidatus Peregrinibacteria bacterium]|nr:MAG: hypothetical protein COB57_02715 [Candidatus Peregrinibacteria bacterium]
MPIRKIKKGFNTTLAFIQQHIVGTSTVFLLGIATNYMFNTDILHPTFFSFLGVLLLLEIYFVAIIRNSLQKKEHSFLNFVFHFTSFSFTTIFLFGLLFTSFVDDNNYLLDLMVKQPIYGLDTGVYFSGITFLSIGYGEIVPHGLFRMIALAEGFIGSFLSLSFFSLGVSQLFLQMKKNQIIENAKRILDKEKDILSQEEKIISKENRQLKKMAAILKKHKNK